MMEDQQNYFLVCQVIRVRTKCCLTLPVTNTYERGVAMVLWLRQKTHDWEVLGSNPHYGDHFSGTIYLEQRLEQKLRKNYNLALLDVL